MKFLTSLLSIGILATVFLFSSSVKAQDAETYVYQRTDTKTHTTYYIKMEFRGYQIKVWARSSSAQRNGNWTAGEVTYTDDHEIKFSLMSNSKKYDCSISYDEYNHDAINLHNITTGKERKYYLSQD